MVLTILFVVKGSTCLPPPPRWRAVLVYIGVDFGFGQFDMSNNAERARAAGEVILAARCWFLFAYLNPAAGMCAIPYHRRLAGFSARWWRGFVRSRVAWHRTTSWS